MSETASISSGIAARYATAIFELAQDSSALPKLEAGVDALAEALETSADLRAMITSPVISRAEQGAAISALAKKMKLPAELSQGLALMAEKRRLFTLPQLVKSLRAMLAEHKGEVTA